METSRNCKFEWCSILIAYEFLHHPTSVIPKVCILSPMYSHWTSRLVGFQRDHHDLTGAFFQVTLFLVRNLVLYYKACGGRYSDIQMEKRWALSLNTISQHSKKDKYSLISYIQKDSPTDCPKELSKDDTNWQSKLERVIAGSHLYTKNYEESEEQEGWSSLGTYTPIVCPVPNGLPGKHI